MKSRLVPVAAIVAATAALSVSGIAFSEPQDMHVQAAALLSRPHALETSQPYEHTYAPLSFAVDAHASAAALLSGRTGGQKATSVAQSVTTVARTPVNAHTHAAALLSGSRTTR